MKDRPFARGISEESRAGRQLLVLLLVLDLLFVSLLTGLPLYADAEQEVRRSNAEDLIKGEKIFGKYCSGCHGRYGQGDGYRMLGPSPADFTSPASRKQSDEELLKTIHEGKPNMPPWKTRLSKQDSSDVLAYIRKLSEQQ